MEDRKNQKIFRRQPILCPWITSQPYHSSQLNKNRMTGQNDPSLTNRFLNNPWTKQVPSGITSSSTKDNSVPSIQQSSSQFFYFLRLMQLFPDTHPATLHTVLTLCKNDFFCAVDKLLYAKRCKILCYKRNLAQRLATNRTSSKNSCNETIPRSTVILRNGNNSGKVDCSNITLNLSTSPPLDENPSKDDVNTISQFASSEESTECTTVPIEDGDTIIINLFPDKAEDLSTLSKCTTEELVTMNVD